MTVVTDTTKFKIVTVPADENGCRFYLEKYKPFRLASLQRDAQAFGSTYAREIAFDDEAWLGRIKNPLATTFVVVQLDDNRVVASTSLIGPLPNATPASNPYQIVSDTTRRSGATNNKSDNDKAATNNESGEPLCFQMSAVYTNPEARGRGLAKCLINTASEEALNRACAEGRPLALSVVVYAANSAAISVYERCGFVTSAEGAKPVFNPLKNETEKELTMYFDEARHKVPIKRPK